MDSTLIGHARFRMIFGVALLLVVVVGGTSRAAADTGTDADVAPADTAIPSDTAGDVSPSDTSSDAGDSAVPDADTTSSDATPDGDTASPDADTTIDDGDAGDTGADGDVTADTGADADAVPADVDAGTGIRFFGRVAVQFRRDDSGVSVVLTRRDGDGRWERTTDAEGQFVFRHLPPGDYRVEVSLSGYVKIEETFLLQGDRQERYQLRKDQNVELQVRALFPGGGDVPDQVSFELDGERGRKTPEDPISVDDDNVATWKVEKVGVGNWTVSASADGYQTVTLDFQARGPEAQSDQLDLRLYMRPEPSEPPAPDTSGCNCGDRDSRGGSPTPGPYAPPALIVVFGLSLVVWRSLRTDG